MLWVLRCAKACFAGLLALLQGDGEWVACWPESQGDSVIELHPPRAAVEPEEQVLSLNEYYEYSAHHEQTFLETEEPATGS